MFKTGGKKIRDFGKKRLKISKISGNLGQKEPKTGKMRGDFDLKSPEEAEFGGGKPEMGENLGFWRFLTRPEPPGAAATAPGPLPR